MNITQNVAQLNAIALNLVDDLFPGGGDIAPGNVPGQLGNIYAFSGIQALGLSDTSVGTLYGGLYQYVKFKDAPTTDGDVGLCVTWNDRDAFEVSVDVAADFDGSLLAGICINDVTANQYGFIQVSGRATVKHKVSITKTVPLIGDSVQSGANADNGLADVLADATAVLFGTFAQKYGRTFGRTAGTVDGTSDLGLVDLIAININHG